MATVRILSFHWGFSVGGVARYAATIDRVGQYAPVEVRSLCVTRPGRSVDEQSLSAMNARQVTMPGWQNNAWLRAFQDEQERFKPHAVFTHGFNGHFMAHMGLALSGSGARQLKRLVSYHGQYHPPTVKKKLIAPVYNGWTARYLRRHADAAVTVAEYCKEMLVGWGVSAAKVAVIHNGLPDRPRYDLEERAAVRRHLNVPEDELLLITASRIEPEKGLGFLIDALSQLSPELPPWHLLVIGDGVLRAYLEHRVNDLGLAPRITFAGFRSDVPRCLAAADVFVLPSLSEAHSFGILEAMRASLPMVVTSVGGNTESVRPDREALVVPPADSMALAEALGRLIGDEGLRGRLGTLARRRFLEEFTEDDMVRKTAQWLVASVQER